MLETYFQDILKTYKTGDATEASYYPDLKNLLENFLNSRGIDPNITIQPKRSPAGIPDFTIRKGKELVGYIEAKELSIDDLQIVEHSEQIKRYQEKLPNFILTNYYDFWLWRRDSLDETKGQWIKKVRIGQPKLLELRHPIIPQNENDFFDLLKAFFSFYIPERKTAKSLAKDLATRTTLIKPEIFHLLSDEKPEEIDRIYDAFKKLLIADLKPEDFADIYAQTITYGLFVARLRQSNQEKFDRFIAERLIPKNIQVLHDTFALISSNALPEAIATYVDDIATVLGHADIESIRNELHIGKGADDPIIYFYETFLAEYDPRRKKSRGVYYTPFPVVSYIVSSINQFLKDKFDKKLGFANEGVTILDPASGTLSFPAQAILKAKEEVDNSQNAGSWLNIVKDHILKDFYAFELLMAPYIIGHLKISLLLEDLGYKEWNQEDHLKLYLTNTLDFSEHKQIDLPGLPHTLSEEAQKAIKIKKETPVLVVLGNPPYSVSSSNLIKEESEYKKLYESYKEIVRKEEKNIQPLSDDYIKFIAFAHWKVKQAGQGIVGMITNNSYLDGLIHRDMRRKLSEDFDEIYILNLHGNSKRKEITPKGKKDENVFDIQQGVSIILLVKKDGLPNHIKYADLFGLRKEKYDFLKSHDIKNTDWQEIESKKPNYFFVTKNIKGEENYNTFISVKEIFEKYNRCVVTSRDEFIISSKKDELKRKIELFLNPNMETEIIKQGLNLKDGRSWKVDVARNKLIKNGIKDDLFINYLYRPFDNEFIYYEDILIERSRKEIMKNMLQNNLGLLLMRQVYWDKSYSHFLVTDSITDSRVFISNRGAADIFPLYLYQISNQKVIFEGQKSLDLEGVQKSLDENGKRSNIKTEIIDKLSINYKHKIAPEEIFYYIYAVLYSNKYRQKYQEFLKIDFPRIPFTENLQLFQKLSNLGKELTDLHLIKSQKLEKSIAKFPATGDNLVEKREYKDKKIYINDKQYFENVELEVWSYYIGGYQVLDKWIKDRIGQILQSEDINHYLRIITAISETILIQKEIDRLYPEVEKNLL